ncbi:LysR substrate-binding domain-containing protein, partial [Halomonas alkalicola]
IHPMLVVIWRDQSAGYATLSTSLHTQDLSLTLPGLMEGRIDFAIAVAKADQLPNEIAFEPLTELLSEPMAREGHPLLGATDWSQMAEARWVLNLAAGSSAQQLIDWLEAQGVSISQRVVKCDSPTLMVELMRRTDLIGFGPRFFVDDPLSGHGLACFGTLATFPAYTIGLLKLRGVPLHPGAERLAILFRRHISALNLSRRPSSQ